MTVMILSICIVLAILFVWVPSIPQNPSYHLFADQRTLLGIPHFWNVISNLPFVLVGLLSLKSLFKHQFNINSMLFTTYGVFFTVVVLIGFGSAWYHLNPNNDTLLWDRLPMTLAFIALFCAIIAEHHDLKLGIRSLWPALLVGMSSVIYWYITESLGRGDLRPYGVVQFMPLIAIPIIIAIKPKPYFPLKGLWWFLGCYVLAKVLEHFDTIIYAGLGIGGHSLKHLTAGLGIYFYGRYLFKRQTLVY